MTRRKCLSRMTPTHFRGLSFDVWNTLIADADEQSMRSPPLVLKWVTLLGSSFSTRLSLIVTSSTVLSPHNSLRPCTIHCDQIIFPILDFWTISNINLVYLLQMECGLHSHHFTSTQIWFRNHPP
ncbi:hypothetical protein BLNAU_23027 [Blattamonas nauphoetae]|uniref:Uncharacterized protein n=1 Tax=Blattamonas nauphoetae TaxID=2049346 RepID=A0ABQ9WRE1_9EUKA|nr:hypothetical protein BLNAU_23027 [Blattamonas nauphoetae]